MRKVIYYFTGTGNSLRVATKIAQRLKDTEIISMRCNPKDVPATDADVIGFVYPVYHWTVPPYVQRFVTELSINPKAYIFVVTAPSYVNGHASEKMQELLAAKGAKIAYGGMVKGVANYVINYPPFLFPKIRAPRTEKKIDKIANDIAGMKTKDIPKAGYIVRKKYPKVMPRYHEYMPFYDYGFFTNEHCTSCGICSKVCPLQNITLNDEKVTFNGNCTHCMACVVYCPNRAIGYKTPDMFLEHLNGSILDATLVKNMGLPPKRKIYRNPYVTTAEVISNRKKIV